jgi:hypothetical protein
MLTLGEAGGCRRALQRFERRCSIANGVPAAPRYLMRWTPVTTASEHVHDCVGVLPRRIPPESLSRGANIVTYSSMRVGPADDAEIRAANRVRTR